MLKSLAQPKRLHDTPARPGLRLWRDWVVANALGELVGLGAAAVIGALLAGIFDATLGAVAGVTLAVTLILLGTFEGVVVGLAQWRVLRRPFPELRRRSWIAASAAGALAAWTLGMIPSTLADFGAAAGGAPPEIDDTLMYGLAAAMGAALGPILGVPQWLVLRRHARRALWWIPANAAAWALGMPVVFVGASAPPAGGLPGIIAVGLLTATAAGAVVGAVHGLALVWLARQPRPSSR
jgi:hypothetical protein